MAIEQDDVATLVRRLLPHHELSTEAKRMGAILRASTAGITLWRLHAESGIKLAWAD